MSLQTIGKLKTLATMSRHFEELSGTCALEVVWSDHQVSEDGISRKGARSYYGLLYGPNAVQDFLSVDHLHGIKTLRAHECSNTRTKRPEMGNLSDGWCLDLNFDDGRFVCTVFTASNYPMRTGGKNRAAVATISGGDGELPTFTSMDVPTRPEALPRFKKVRFERHAKKSPRASLQKTRID